MFALDWQKDQPIWLLDGEPIKQTHYEWRVPVPAHILVTNQLGMVLKGSLTFRIEENIAGLKIAVQYPSLMSVVNGARDRRFRSEYGDELCFGSRAGRLDRRNRPDKRQRKAATQFGEDER